MLHLLPIRLLLSAFALLVGVVVFAAVYAGVLGGEQAFQDVGQIARWASGISFGAIIVSYAAWRWIPAVQQYIFPYLGGTWEGYVEFDDKGGNSTRKTISAEVSHTLFGIRLLMESDESTSHTLAVHADKTPGFDRYKLYYIYLNERKDGVAGAKESYRGLAIVRCSQNSTPELIGDYFTETHRKGVLHLSQTSVTAFWKLWR